MPDGLLAAGVLTLAYLAAVYAADEIETRRSLEPGPIGPAPAVGGLLGVALLLAVGAACSPPG
ncbi:hypothetical protein [Nocardiopsis sp. CC223A]|uniref:hypothetical protein n=1 Tax=Nocardiopsis sp. CC223A TaxID=3044051 RepID=UPI00278C2442|nr:hypothetical protein [Nocardiopsis sp. CC223A]